MPAGQPFAPISGVRLTLRTLGAMALHVVRPDREPELALDAGKQLALITYLALAPDWSASRARLIDLLWSDRADEPARNALRVTLSHLRRRLGPNVFAETTDPVTLTVPIDTDCDALLAAWERGDTETVVRLYTGDFVPAFAIPGGGEFEAWASVERARLREIFVRSAESVVRRWLSAARHRDATALARRVRDTDRHNQASWRLVLECVVASRDPIDGATEAAALEQVLAEDDIEPEPSTRALLRQARTPDGVPNDTRSGAHRERATPPSAPVIELVGREREFSAVLGAWDEARAGRVAHVHVVAPAGFGKTRLLLDIQARLRASQARVVHTAARFGARDVAYAFAADLAGALGARRGAGGVSTESARALVALNPTLSASFNATPDPATDDEALRRRALAVRELAVTLTEDQPLALLLDDLHWSDPLSLRLLDAVLGALDRARVLVVTAARPTRDAWQSAERATRVVLDPLSADAIATLVASLAPLPPTDWAEQLPDTLRGATGGSPLLILETLQLLQERSILTPLPAGWTTSDSNALFDALSQGSALRHRIATLGMSERRLLLILAVAGVPLDEREVRVAAAVADGEFDVTVAALEQRGLVTRRGNTLTPAHDEHAATVLDATSDDEARTTAAAVGRVLAAASRDDPQHLRLAALLLARGKDVTTLARVFDRFVRRMRLDGDRRSDRSLAHDLLGASADDALVTTLVRSLPWLVRARLVSARRITAATAVLLLFPVSLATAAWIAGRPPGPRPEVVLLAERRSADGSHVDFLDVPVTADQLTGTPAVDVGLTRTPRWRMPDSILRYTPGGWSARPDGQGWAMTRAVRDSGVLDVFDVRLDGTARRLTFARSDDAMPGWAPDGSQFVFATMRWATYGHYDLAVYDMRSAHVRRLTGPDDDTDARPVWSPDGSQIVFDRTRTATGRVELCVVDASGAHPRCAVPTTGVMWGNLGWADPHHVLLQVTRNDVNALVRIDVDTRRETVIHSGGAYDVSPDGRYVLCTCPRRGYPAGSRFLFPADVPDEVKLIAGLPSEPGKVDLIWSPTSPRTPYLATLRIAGGPGQPMAGVPYQLRTSGLDSAGRAVDVGVVRWRSFDTTVASVDSAGLLRPRHAGRLMVEASAGGWRIARTELTVIAPNSRVLLDERWAGELAPTWVPFGEPKPDVVPSDAFGGAVAGVRSRAFRQTGDGTFWSGAYTARAFDVRGGLWVEAAFSVRVTAPPGPSQEQIVSLFAFGDSSRWATWDHATADYPRARFCRIYYPAPNVARTDTGTGEWIAPGGNVSGGDHALRVPRRVGDGQPFRALVQVFPDGRCGFAFDGRPLWVGPPAYFDRDARVMLVGNSQETRVLVGPVRVATGIAPHVAWNTLDSAAPAPMVLPLGETRRVKPEDTETRTCLTWRRGCARPAGRR